MPRRNYGNFRREESMNTEPYWSLAVVRGTCKKCGRVTELEHPVNRNWINNMTEDGERKDEPIAYGYMGDCACGALLDGRVSWPFLAVFEEEEL